jgi:hypothetical protein
MQEFSRFGRLETCSRRITCSAGPSRIVVAGIERVAAMAAAERPDVTLLDAPVSGSRDPAEQGQLTIFASGPEEARSRVAPLFDALGQRTIWVGAVGAGSRLKLVNNTLVAFAAEGVATSVALARRLGLETETVMEAVGGGPLVSPWLGDQDLTVVTRVLEQQAVPLGGPVQTDHGGAAGTRLEFGQTIRRTREHDERRATPGASARRTPSTRTRRSALDS